MRIDFAAMNPALAQPMRLTYLLDGIDSGWQDAGARRHATYQHLAAGTYTFRVAAVGRDALRFPGIAVLSFEILPAATHAVWFSAFSAVCVALGWGLHRLGMRGAFGRLTRGLEERGGERERIARDLHDTLLQSTQGLILTFQRIAWRTPESHPSRPLMDQALSLAVKVLEEGRDKVGNLRGYPGNGDLAAELGGLGRHLSAQSPAKFMLVQTGAARKLHVAAYDELLSIGREAIHNAFVHAGASQVRVELAYHECYFALYVADDGHGIDEACRAGKPGHWGIPGMRERAVELGASLELDSGSGKGAIWRLTLPSKLAYAASAHGSAQALARVASNAQ